MSLASAGAAQLLHLGLEDVAFTWPFTTQSINRDFKAVRDGLYGLGPMQRLANEFPAELSRIYPLQDDMSQPNVRILSGEAFAKAAEQILKAQNGGKLDAKMVCKTGGMTVDATMAGKFSSDNFELTMTSKSAGTAGQPMTAHTMSMKMEARRTGECTGKEKS